MAQATRTFRIFVSSTFSDLKEERNALQRYVFPRLRELCTQAGCRFQAIDLRWGVREEAGLDQETMKICLDEVSRSQRTSPRPNFIVLLGDRYGWRPLPAEIPAREFEHIEAGTGDAADRQLLDTWYKRDDNARSRRFESDPPASARPVYCLQPRRRGDRFAEFQVWEREVERPLRQILLRGIDRFDLTEDELRKYDASATEQEIAAGALKVPGANEHVFGFFRKIDDLPENQGAREFVDLDERGFPDRDARTKLDDLKDLLETRLPGNIHHYHTSWTGNGATGDHIGTLPESLEDCTSLLEHPDASSGLCFDVWRRLAEVILKEIKGLESINLLDREIADHKAFAEDRARSFTGRASIRETIRDYLARDDRHPLALWGDSGSGKSALMAQAIADCESRFANREIVSRFIGATPASSDGRSLLESLCRQITRTYGSDEATIPTGYRELVKEFAERLKLATVDRPLVLFLDALDQLSDADNARNLIWLPAELPENVRIVVSTLPGECKTSLERKVPESNVKRLEPMPKAEAEELLEAWLVAAGRTLQHAQRTEVLDKFALSAMETEANASANEKERGMPLYLRLAFEEARRWKSYTRLVDEHSATAGEAAYQTRKLAPNIPGIISQLFERLSLDTNHGPVIVSRSLGYLASAKNGLSEDEMLEVLASDVDVYANFLKVSRHIPSDLWPRLKAHVQEIGDQRHPEDWLKELYRDEDRLKEFVARMLGQEPKLQLPVILWSRLYFDLEPYLTERRADGASLMSFYHRQLAEVVNHTFLAGDGKPKRHAHLAAYFAGQELFNEEKKTPNIRKLSELPYQQTHAGQWDQIHETLTDFDFLEAKCTHVAVVTYGKGADARTIYGGVYELQEDYRRALENWGGDPGARPAGPTPRYPLVITAWVSPVDQSHAAGCPLCRIWSEIPATALGTEIECPQCKGPLKINPFTINLDWRPVAGAWRGGGTSAREFGQ